MSNIPFNLPSNQDIEIVFREPTVKDCLDFCSIDESQPEKAITQFLNQLSGEESRHWTRQDRITALWWIFINTSADTTLAFEYLCQYCNKKHIAMVDLVDLGAEATSLVIPAFIDDEIQFSGVKHKIRIYPFSGYVAERLDSYWQALPNSALSVVDRKKLTAEIKLAELAYSFSFYDQSGDLPESVLVHFDEKFKAIGDMSRLNELPELISAIEAANKLLEHGLKYTYVNGIYQLLTSDLTACDDKEGVNHTLRLLIPFRPENFIPEI